MTVRPLRGRDASAGPGSEAADPRLTLPLGVWLIRRQFRAHYDVLARVLEEDRREWSAQSVRIIPRTAKENGREAIQRRVKAELDAVLLQSCLAEAPGRGRALSGTTMIAVHDLRPTHGTARTTADRVWCRRTIRG